MNTPFIDPIVMQFLRDLAVNNNKEWFQANNDYYKRAKTKFEEGAKRFIELVRENDPTIGPLEVKNCTYRIYKDVRFSRDKSPYKINMGAFVVKDGKKSGNAGYYIHIEPDACFFGGGLHCPEPNYLLGVRNEIFNNGETFNTILTTSSFQKAFNTIDAEALKTAPKGFSKDYKYVDLLKFKSYTVGCKLTDEEPFTADFEKRVTNYIKELKPFVQYLNNAVKDVV